MDANLNEELAKQKGVVSDRELSVALDMMARSSWESCSLVITANQPFSEWNSIFPDNVMSVAAIDRLIHHASIIKFEGGSYRRRLQMNEKKKKKTGKDN